MERISAYVPQVRHGKFSYPLLACDVRSIDTRHIGWSDPVREFEYYNMALDVEHLLPGLKWPVLSIVHHWPPNSPTETSYNAKNDKRAERSANMYGALETGQ